MRKTSSFRSGAARLGCLLLSLTFSSSVQAAQTGPGYALTFDGASGYVGIPNYLNRAPSGEVTVEFWQFANAASLGATFAPHPPQPGTLVVGSDFSARVPAPDGQVYWDFGNINLGGRLVYLPPVSPAGSWQHFAFVASQSGNYMKIYRNGNLEAQKSGMTPLIHTNLDLDISGVPAGLPFGGSIDEFRIWNVARTQDQIIQNMHHPLTGSEPGLVAYWPFNDGPGNFVSDSSVDGNNPGFLSGGANWLHSTAPFVPDASVISSGFTGWSNTVLSASVDPDSLPTTAWFVWGPGTNLNNTTSAMDLGNGADPVQMSFPLAGLAPATKYTFRVAASNLGGGILGNTAFMMTTWATLPPLPVTNSTDNPGDPQSLPGEILLAPPNSKLVVPTLLTGTLLLTNGPLPIAPNLVIEGNCNFVIDGNGSNQAFVPITTTIQVSGVTFSNCTGIDGGAIYIASTGTFIASNCTFVANSASASGGGIYVASGGTLELRQCTFLLNQAGYGGAVDAYGDAALYNCTIATNIVSFSGGGVHVESGGTASLNSCTLAGNFAFEGGGIEDDAGGGALSLQNSIVAHNIAGAGGGPDVANPVPGFASSGYNLISRDDGSTGWRHNGLKDDDMLGTSGSPAYPLLSRLDNFGGCTATMELLPGSPAIDAGLSGGLAFDQRGYMRSNNVLGKLTVPGDYSDIGAFEVQSIDITNAPTLIIFRSGTNNAIVLWDAKAKAYTLDYTQDLKPAPPWSPVPSTPVLTNGGTQLTVTRSFLQTKEFYRLRAP